MENKRKIVSRGVILLAVLAVMLAVMPSASAQPYPANSTYFVPMHSTGAYCENNTIVEIRINTSVTTAGAGMDIYFDPSCVNITAVDWTGSAWPPLVLPGWTWSSDHIHMVGTNFVGQPSGDYKFANLTLHCINDTNDCTSYLNFSNVVISDLTPAPVQNVAWHNGTIDCTGAAGPINVDIRADGINVIIFNAPNYPVYPGTVTEDGITINNQTAMGAMVVYCQENGINVNISTGTWGNWTTQIGSNASDMYSWMYAVDETSPPYAADLYALSGGEKVHWYNYNIPYYQVLTTLNTTSIKSGDYLTATVTWENTTGTYLLNGASVYETDTLDLFGFPTTGSLVGTTDSDGNCTFEADETGRWYVYAVDPVHGSGQYNWPTPYFDCLPDLEITDICTEIKVGNKFNTTIIYYNITNTGDAKAGRSVSNLTVNGVEQKKKSKVKPLAPGETLTKFFRYRSATPPNTIKVCADYNNRIAESNETNNCREEPYL